MDRAYTCSESEFYLKIIQTKGVVAAYNAYHDVMKFRAENKIHEVEYAKPEAQSSHT